MASIKGISVKNVVNFKGHEGEDLVQCDVCYLGKKVGFFSQDSWGGEDHFDLDYNLPIDKKEDLYKKFKEIPQEYLQERLNKGEKIEFYEENKEFFNISNVILDIIELKDLEKEYKKRVKIGRDVMLAYTKSAWELSILGWSSKSTNTLESVMETYKLDKSNIRYFIQSEKDFEIA